MNATALFRFLLAGILVLMPALAIAQASANFKSPAFAVNAGVGDMTSTGFNVRASVGQPFSPAALSSTNFAVTTGLLAIPVTTSTTGNLPVFNTGVAADRTLLPGGSVDPHYTLIASADVTLPGPNAIVTTQIADGYWIAQGPDSKWIAPSANQSYPGATPCNAAGSYTYRTLVDLTGFDPATAVIQGKWAVDNQGTAIRLNGTSIGATQPGYNPFAAFTINSGFIAGVNTLDFVTADQGCPNGMRVELSGTAKISGGGQTVPGAPTIGSATSGNGQATINFTAPANNGGSAITGYTATCSSIAAITRTATALTSPITVTNLTNFVGYNCSVTAANSAGTGPASAPVTVLPIGAPGIVSSGTANGVVNTPFSYQILTNAVASSYGVSGALPSGVTLDTVTGVISGTPTQSGTFNVTLSATNGGGTGTLPLSITIAANAVTFIEAVSRKTHGIAGTYELVLDSAQFVTGNVTVEPRFMGAGHQIVFKFDGPINNEGFLTVTDSTGASITTGTHARLGNEVIVTLTGNLNARRVAVTLLGVNGSVNVGTVLGFLLGDVNNSRNVNAQDTSRIKARAGQLANASNFLHDISVSGRITAVDVIVSKVLNGTVLP